ncbi:MAG: hypothetical protein AAGF01_06130 [Cyanobacteria bacterium P01_G01_bin.38]
MQLIFCLFAGLIIAFALQLISANLGVALGLTVLNWSPDHGDSKESKPESESGGSDLSLPITHLVGFGVALSLSAVLFVAALLTTEFSEIAAPRRGSIFGIILWATYWLLFAWLSSTTISSIADSILGTAVSGGRRLIAALRQATRSEQPEQSDRATLQTLAREVTQLTRQQQQLPQLLAEQKEDLLAELSSLNDRRSSVGDDEAISSKTMASSVARSKTMALDPAASVSKGIGAAAPDFSNVSTVSSNLLSQFDLPSWRQILRQAIDRVDWSDWDVEALWHHLRSDDSAMSQDAILQDAESYLRQTPIWILQSEMLSEAFYERLYDPEAAPDQIEAQLAKLDRTHFIHWLRARGDLAAEHIESLAEQLSSVQNAVMTAVSSNQDGQEETDADVVSQIQEKLIAYCRYTNLDLLTPESLAGKVQSQLQAHSLSRPVSQRIQAQLDLEAIETTLSRRQGIVADQQHALMASLVTALPNLPEGEQIKSSLRAPRRWALRAGRSTQSLAEQIKAQIICYLRHQNKSAFQPAQIAQALAHIVRDALSNLSFGESLTNPFELPDMAQLTALFDKSTWRQTLETRRDMTAAEIQQILEWGESAWQQATQQVDAWVQTLWTKTQTLLTPENDGLLDTARQQVIGGLAATQQTLETQVAAVTADIQAQTNAVRRQVAIAAWWLFFSLLFSGVSAAIAGWLAATY